MEWVQVISKKIDENGWFVYPLLSAMTSGGFSAWLLNFDNGVLETSFIAGLGYTTGITIGHLIKRQRCPYAKQPEKLKKIA